MTCFSGIWVPLITPFQNGDVDIPALQAMTRRMADAGVSGFVVCGSTGEAAALSHSEQLMVLDAVIDAVPDCPVMMGLAGNNMASLASMLKQVQSRPIAGLLVPPPYYIRPSQTGIIAYFRTLADAASVPVVIYNIPYRTGVVIDLATMRAIAKHERIVALKDCGGDQALTMNLIADGELDVLAGDDMQILSTLCFGGTGAIAASAHIRPDLFVCLMQHVKSGELAQAREIFYRLLPIMQLLFSDANPGPLKAALSLMGMISDELRPPMQMASTTLKDRLKEELMRLEKD
ncbi:MAG: 4-hydroxy-tetrahydrodipicolinate synthase [Burkholderiales bacterium RIFCSPLOWO2_02_FULL_57_36]|nr:MAG: 4-hydroxy-tetrahydrodipicolinate synthase [Burkholderiales bacterium RIFCSPLOWO2_02_FULL_57_36]